MADFIKDLSSLHFWLAVVVVGLLLEIGGHLLAKSVDKFLSRTSSWWKFRSETKTAKRQKLIEELRADTKEQTLYLVTMAVNFLLAFFAATMAVTLFAVGFTHDILKDNAAPPDSNASFLILLFKVLSFGLLFFAYIAFGSFSKNLNILRATYRDFNPTEKDMPDKT